MRLAICGAVLNWTLMSWPLAFLNCATTRSSPGWMAPAESTLISAAHAAALHSAAKAEHASVMVFMIGSCRSIQACPGFSTVTYITARMKPQSAGAALHPAALRASGVASIAELPFGFRQEFIEGNIMKRPRRKFLLLAACAAA